MSKVRLIVDIDVIGEGRERESLHLEMTLNKDNPSDDHIAQAIYDEVTQHLYESPWEAEEPQP